jgi:hypothetical protein
MYILKNIYILYKSKYLAATLMQNVKHQLCLVGGFSVCASLSVAYFVRILYIYVARELSMDLLVQFPDCYSCVGKKRVEDIFVGSIRFVLTLNIILI